MPPTTSPSRAKSKDTVAPVTVKFGGTALGPEKANKLDEVVVKKVRVLPDMAYVRIADPGQTLVGTAIAQLGDPMEVLAGEPSAAAPKTIFKGIVTAVEPEFRDDGVYVAFRGYDKGHAMTRTKHTRVFQDQTIGDIVTAVAGKYYSPFAVDGATGGALEYMMQSNESDWDFVWRLAGMIGFELASDGDGAKFRKIGKADGDGPWMQYGQSEPGHRLYSFRPRYTAANLPRSVKAKYVTPGGMVLTTSVPVSGGMISTIDKAVSAASAAGPLDGQGEFAAGNIVAKDAQELQKAVEAIRDRLLAQAVEAEGVAEGHPGLRPGVKVEFKGLGPFSGKYLLSEVVHVYRGGAGFKSRFHIAARPKNLLEAVAPASSAGAAPTGRDSTGSGLMQGEVTNTNDPDKLGRIRVKLPNISQESDPEGWWARIATTSAGKERGVLMLPQVGDKVIVGFENGDTRAPVVLGSVWDGKAPPGKDLVHDDGSFSIMSDSKVLMKAQDNFEFVTEKAWTGKAQKAITFENSMDTFTIKSGKEIVIKAPTIKLEADMAIEMKGAQIKVNGNATMELKAPSVTVGGGSVKLG